MCFFIWESSGLFLLWCFAFQWLVLNCGSARCSLTWGWGGGGAVLRPVGSACPPPTSVPAPAFSPSVFCYFFHPGVHTCASAADTFTCVCVCVLNETEGERKSMSGFEQSVFTLTGTNWSKPIPPFYFFSSELLMYTDEKITNTRSCRLFSERF